MHATNDCNSFNSGTGRTRRARLLRRAVLGLAAAALVGCSASSKSLDASLVTIAPSQERAPATSFAADTTAAAAAFAEGGRTTSPTPTPEATDPPVSAAAGRLIIRTAELGIQVGDVTATAALVQTIVTGKGGYVASQQGRYANQPVLSMVLRVPARSFEATLTGLRGLGRLTDLSTASNEVTAQVVDLDSRLRTARASADRLRTLLGAATKAADLIDIERELSTREADIESMQGQRNVLGDQVSLSTITLALSSTEQSVVRTPTEQHQPSFVSGLRSGGRALLRAGRTAAPALGAVLPFLPVVALLALGVRLVLRRRRRASAASTDAGLADLP